MTGSAPSGSPTIQESFEHSPPVEPLPVKPSLSAATSGPEIVITASGDVPRASLEKLRRTAEKAVAYFQAHYGTVNAPLRFAVGDATSALRAGYSFEQRTISLPDGPDILNCGLDSEDIINHEIFHALVHQAYPDYCSKEQMESNETERLHEALADYFAHRLQPDDKFGESYYLNEPHVRLYHNSLRISLTAGAHGQGNAISKLLLEQEVSDSQVRGFLSAGDFSLEGLARTSPDLAQSLAQDAPMAVDEKVGGYPHAARDRYWLKPNRPLELDFLPNSQVQEAHPDFHVVWTDKKGMPSRWYTFEETSPNKFSISGVPEAESEKVIARFYDGDRLIGFRPFYFGVRE